MSDNIKVVVKVRPLISREIEDKLSYQWRVQDNTLFQLDHHGKDAGVAYTFDKVYDTNTKTSDVYNDIAKPIVEAATAGFNGTIFAYGQTSSGKTYTMTGTEEAPGIIPLAIFNLFEIIKTIPNRDFLVRVSYLEIYNEMLIDLLNIEKKNIKVQETLQGVKVDCKEKVTSSPEEVLDVMKEGKANRQTAATNMNEESSRSHSIFQITIESREHIEGEEEGGCVNVSQLNLVDLAGSERAGQTGATGIRFKEGTHINKSLSVLALVIKQLSDDPNKHANYRDSKLTRILQNSLGGNAKTSIICAVTPAAVEETISTLQFANRAKSIKNKPAVNAVATDATMIQQLTKQLSHLKTELENKKSVEKSNHALQKQITALQKLILNGFGHRSTAEMLNPRRKLVQPRRITISTLHSIEEDPVPSVPKFCTPSLKYNPLVLPGAPDFLPIQNAVSLPTLPEEPPRLVTPPPRDKKVNFDDEIIEIDSDDDCTGEPQTCPTSPYHKCYESSKTPPCILRKNVKRAEKSLKEIVELTEREKIFTPSVVELMEKLEQNATVIAKLEDEVNKLNTLSKEKDTEMEKLKRKISKAEEEFKMISLDKVKLETICKEYDTKLTDSEVCYETLKNKAKRREEELLSLLEEQAPKKPSEKIGKISTTIENFDQPIFKKNDNEQTKLSDPQAQLALKDETIKELNSIISTHEERVISLEGICKEYQNNLESYKEKLSCVEKQVQDHKNTVESLNKIIETQNENIQIVNSDIESYKQLIQELQIKLRNKENININDTHLETLLAKEETFIASNDNIRNIIQGFKITLQAKNQEIQTLKETAENNDDATLKEEIHALKTQANDYVSKINEISLEKNNWLETEKQLGVQISDLLESKNNLEKENEDLFNQIKEIKAANEQLSNDLLKKEQDLTSVQETYWKEIQDKCNKIDTLEIENKSKDEIIASLKKSHEESNEHFTKAKCALSKVQSIIAVLTGNMQSVPDIIDNFVILFNTLVQELATLETIATSIISQKKVLLDLIKQCENEHAIIGKQIDNIIEKIDIANLDQLHISLQDEPEESNIDNREQVDVEIQRISQEKLSTFNKLKYRINKLIRVIDMSQNSHEEKIQSLNKEIASLKICLSNHENDQEGRANELLLAKQEIEEQGKLKQQLLNNILNKTVDLTLNFNIENNISCKLGNEEDNVYEEILLTLDKIANHITLMNHKNVNDNLEEVLLEAKKQIRELTEQNLKFISDITRMEAKNVDLFEELRKIRQENKYLSEDLEKSGKVLELLRAELDMKLTEMDNIQEKAKQWKDQFITLDFLMKEQVHALRLENSNFMSRYSGSIIKMNDIDYSESDSNTDSSNYQPSFCTDPPIELKSPQSLLTLCCNRIVDVMQSNENLSQNHTELSSTNVCESIHQHIACQCNKFQAELKEKEEENLKLQTIIEQLRSHNKNLTKEQDEIQHEVKSLLDITYELQKKVLNHRTNLSTLTATTYAENKSLSSQIKCLQHLHNRFHTVCQRDIPAFKQQLQELMTLLKNENLMNKDNIKRLSLPNALDVTEIPTSFKNESTLDGDLLMLDTNVTLTTTGDTTLVGHDETCFDVTQVCVYNEVACQTVVPDVPSVTDSILSNPQMTINPNENTEALNKLEELKKENYKLREMVDEYLVRKESQNSLDAQTSPIKTERDSGDHFSETLNYEDLLSTQENHLREIDMLSQKVLVLESEKANILDKYNNLVLETPSTESLVKKLTILQKEFNSKVTELDNVKSLLNKNIKEMAALQDENDNLSTQVMEVISELDELKKEHDNLKSDNSQLSDNNLELQKELEKLKYVDENIKFTDCPQCEAKDKLINSLQEKVSLDSHIRLSRSLSDSERSSSYNTICTLQSELHAGKEDCNKLKEEVTTIKNHLDRSNLSIGQEMDLDESIGEPNIFTYAKDLDSIEPKCNIPDIPEEHYLDIYALDKTDCINYYIEMTATDKKDFNRDVKIIDVMKLLYNNVMTKHTNEVENLVNKIRDFEDCKIQLQSQLETITKEHSSKTKELQQHLCDLETVKCVFSQIKENISKIENESEESNDPIKLFRDCVLKPLDSKFGLNSTVVFDSVLQNVANKFKNILDEKSSQCTKLEESIKNIQDHCSTITSDLSQLKSQLTEKENEFNLLKKQKERIQEISNAVTLDIVKKEKELIEIINEGCKKLSQHNILEQGDIDQLSPPYKNIDSIFALVIKYFNNKHILMEQQKVSITQEVTNLKTAIESKNLELQTLTDCINGKENDLITQTNLFKDLNQIYEKKVQENEVNLNVINKMHEEINKLKDSLSSKEITIQTLESKLIGKNETECLEDKINELLLSKQNLEAEINNLKSVNREIIKERDSYAKQLEESGSAIIEKKKELESLNSDVIVLKESVKENVNIMENMKQEIKSLFEQNAQLKQQLQEKTQDCSRLEMNIKTHEKTAEIQSRMIMRLQKQKEDESEKDKQIEELKKKCEAVQSECDSLKQDIKSTKEELHLLQNSKQKLEMQISELQESHKPRLSMEADTRRRRQSIHDSKRMFAEDKSDEDHHKMEAHFASRQKNDEFFMEVDGVESNGSTPLRLSKGRDSSQFKNDQSDKDDDPPSRPSSVMAARRRRQSVHDLHRSVLSQTPSPHDTPRHIRDLHDVEKQNSHHADSEVSELKKQLASCQEELEDLKEKYKELDDECETCAEYLRERDEQCLRLKKDKRALEQAVTELQAKLQNPGINNSSRRCSFSDAAVNTDEDWTNLHSVVVDRMSYDAEVEKNKKLTKLIEELRFKKQELRTTMAKMQKALEKKSLQDNRDKELEATKSELQACREELEELKERYKELDEECETCAEYLRERDEQCRKLKEAKAALEAKLKEYEDDASNITLSVRKKRQTLHDQNRLSTTSELVDASTETNEDFLSYQVEKDTPQQTPDEAQLKEMKRLRIMIDRLSQQKLALEQRLLTAPLAAPLYVASGSAIVQNQQLTDVMKENQKLKKVNARLINICKKRGKTLSESNRENQDPSENC